MRPALAAALIGLAALPSGACGTPERASRTRTLQPRAAQLRTLQPRAPQPRAPLATVVLVAGSGFHGVSPHGPAGLSLDTAVWRSWGYRTRLAPYRSGKNGLTDVATAVRAAKRTWPSQPLCVYGESSGGTWALVVAAHNADVACVVVSAAPTDQETWARSERHGAQRLARHVWPGFFGDARRDDAYEPFDVWKAARPRIPVFLLYARGDQAVPAQQGLLFSTLGPDTTLRVLDRGRHGFVHGDVNTAQLARARRAISRFVATSTR